MQDNDYLYGNNQSDCIDQGVSGVVYDYILTKYVQEPCLQCPPYVWNNLWVPECPRWAAAKVVRGGQTCVT